MSWDLRVNIRTLRGFSSLISDVVGDDKKARVTVWNLSWQCAKYKPSPHAARVYYGIRHIFCMWVLSCKEPCNAQITQYANQYARFLYKLAY